MKSLYFLAYLSVGAIVGHEVPEYINDDPYLSYILPFEPKVSSARPGDEVTLIIVRCNHTSDDFEYTTSRTLVNDDENRYPDAVLKSVRVSIKPGCNPGDSKVNFVPLDTRPGIYHFEGVANSPGLFRHHAVHWRSTSIEVKP